MVRLKNIGMCFIDKWHTIPSVLRQNTPGKGRFLYGKMFPKSGGILSRYPIKSESTLKCTFLRRYRDPERDEIKSKVHNSDFPPGLAMQNQVMISCFVLLFCSFYLRKNLFYFIFDLIWTCVQHKCVSLSVLKNVQNHCDRCEIRCIFSSRHLFLFWCKQLHFWGEIPLLRWSRIQSEIPG